MTKTKDMLSAVRNPKHYNWDMSRKECIDANRAVSFNISTAHRYMSRCGHKDAAPQDLSKAIWYSLDLLSELYDKGHFPDQHTEGLDLAWEDGIVHNMLDAMEHVTARWGEQTSVFGMLRIMLNPRRAILAWIIRHLILQMYAFGLITLRADMLPPHTIYTGTRARRANQQMLNDLYDYHARVVRYHGSAYRVALPPRPAPNDPVWLKHKERDLGEQH